LYRKEVERRERETIFHSASGECVASFKKSEVQIPWVSKETEREKRKTIKSEACEVG